MIQNDHELRKYYHYRTYLDTKDKHISIFRRLRFTKALHKESCPGEIYDIGPHYLPDDPTEPKHLWICLTTGELMKKSTNTKKVYWIFRIIERCMEIHIRN